MTEEMLPFCELLEKNREWYCDDALNNLFEIPPSDCWECAQGCHHIWNRQTNLPVHWLAQPGDWIRAHTEVLPLRHRHCPHVLQGQMETDPGWFEVDAGGWIVLHPYWGRSFGSRDTLEKCHMFILGNLHLTLAVDHEPLVKLLGDRDLHDIPNRRLLWLKEKTLMYRIKMKYVPGKDNKAASWPSIPWP